MASPRRKSSLAGRAPCGLLATAAEYWNCGKNSGQLLRLPTMKCLAHFDLYPLCELSVPSR